MKSAWPLVHYIIKFLVIGLVVTSMTTKAQAETKEFILCSENQSYPPYLMGSGDNFPEENPGVLVEIISAAIKEAGLNAKFLRRPWKRCLNLLERNKIDGIFASIHLKEREELGRYPYLPLSPNIANRPDPEKRLRRVTYSLFKNPDSPFNWDGKDITNMRHSIGAPVGYVVVKKLKKDHGINANTRHLPSKGLQHVAEGHLDAYIIEGTIGRSLIDDLKLDNRLIEIKPPFAEYDWYMMISHGFYQENPSIAEKIWTAIGRYREEHIQRLIEHYNTLP